MSLSDAPTQRWRNGGGSTQELLTWPSADSWHVRISVARIEHDGPFSAFPDVERWFAVVHGDGVTLQFADSAVVQRPGDPPVRFDGATAPRCTLLNEATVDLNLMVRRGAHGAGVMLHAATGVPWVSDRTLRAVYTADAATLVTADHGATTPPADTLAWSDDSAGNAWQLTARNADAPMRAWWMACQ
jgi:uncharacterized protein